MRFAKPMVVALIAAAVSIGAVSASAAPTHPETVFLNSFTADNSSGGNTTSATTTLSVGKKYLITVQGTFSAWTDWGSATNCGSPGAAPLFPTPGLTSTPVGDDAAFRYAAPLPTGACPAGKFPQRTHFFQINLGSGWVPFDTLLKPTKPHGGKHTYATVVTGQGSAPMFRIVDWHPSDNNGELKITIL